MMDNIVSFTTAHALPATASFIASFFGACLRHVSLFTGSIAKRSGSEKLPLTLPYLKLFMIWADGTKLISGHERERPSQRDSRCVGCQLPQSENQLAASSRC